MKRGRETARINRQKKAHAKRVIKQQKSDFIDDVIRKNIIDKSKLKEDEGKKHVKSLEDKIYELVTRLDEKGQNRVPEIEIVKDKTVKRLIQLNIESRYYVYIYLIHIYIIITIYSINKRKFNMNIFRQKLVVRERKFQNHLLK